MQIKLFIIVLVLCACSGESNHSQKFSVNKNKEATQQKNKYTETEEVNIETDCSFCWSFLQRIKDSSLHYVNSIYTLDDLRIEFPEFAKQLTNIKDIRLLAADCDNGIEYAISEGIKNDTTVRIIMIGDSCFNNLFIENVEFLPNRGVSSKGKILLGRLFLVPSDDNLHVVHDRFDPVDVDKWQKKNGRLIYIQKDCSVIKRDTLGTWSSR